MVYYAGLSNQKYEFDSRILRMKIKDVKWTEKYNVFTIECDCGNIFEWPAIYSVAQCLNCLKENILHSNEKDHPLLVNRNLEVADIDLVGFEKGI